MGEKEAPDRMADPEPNAIGVPSAELSLGWMLASRANLRFTRRGGDTDKRSRKQEQSKVVGQEARQSVAKKRSFFVQRMGSTSGCIPAVVMIR
jgi:hypothetical protein